jgi:ABC-type transport system involved in multi-copper enzyme maturation permease subunit
LFGWSGCLLPLLLSAGILGDDIASGRISLLVTKPIRPSELYLYRLLGLSVQVTVHLVIASAVILVLHQLTGRGSVDHFATWWVATWLIFHAWAALSASLSVVVKRANNSMLLFVATGLAVYLMATLKAFLPDAMYTKAFEGILRYAGPPIEFLSEMGAGKSGVLHGVGSVGHSLVLTVLYGGIGILLLGHREFKRTGD